MDGLWFPRRWFEFRFTRGGRFWIGTELGKGNDVKPQGFLLDAQVLHTRMRPAHHHFVYPVFCVRLALSDLNVYQNTWFGINRWRPLSVRTRDFGGRNDGDLQQWLQGILKEHGISADGECFLQCFPRVLGYAFNPVCFFIATISNLNCVRFSAK